MHKEEKLKIFLAITLALCLNFNIANFSLANEHVKAPDYAKAFTGKDKLESYNRKMFIFNSKLNKYVLRPANTVWASIMPKYGMDRIQSACKNLEYPKRVVSCLLQKDFKSSGKETVRFLTNSTIGIGGLYDPAKKLFKIEPKQEDMEQVLAKYKVKKGPYIVLPVLPPSNLRGVAGKVLDAPLDPSLYALGPVTAIIKAGLFLNKTSYNQPLAKAIENTYADPYEITKKLYGLDNYIKNSNLDRKEVLAEIATAQNIYNSENVQKKTELMPDVELENYEAQGPIVDSMRTAFFDEPSIKKSMWSELSIWNRSFAKKIKSSYVSLDETRPDYKFRYILQKNKKSPLAILYPSIGEGVMSHHPIVLAKLFYDQGYSVIIQGSTFNWEFVKSSPIWYRPGFPSRDAEQARIATKKIINKLKEDKECEFSQKTLVGTSFGAMTALYIAAKEKKNDTLNISNYISINPPIDIFYALNKLDKNSLVWNKDPEELKRKVAVAAGKILQATKEISENGGKYSTETLPFTDEEAKYVTGFVMQQKLSDLIFTIENISTAKKTDIYKTINGMNYYDYAKKYLFEGKDKSLTHSGYDLSLYSLRNFLIENDNYKIYHALDDYFVNQEQLAWLKQVSKGKSVYFSNGSHMGFLYRKEFINSFNNDIALPTTKPEDEMFINPSNNS